MNDKSTEFSEERKLELVDILYTSWKTKMAMAPISNFCSINSLNEAYQIQQRFVNKIVHEVNGRIVGKKIGAIQQAVQKRYGINEPVYGHLFDFQDLSERKVIPASTLIAPRVECEIALIIDTNSNQSSSDSLNILGHNILLAGALDIADTRIKDWSGGIYDIVADNTASGFFMLGPIRKDTEGIIFDDESIFFSLNGNLLESLVFRDLKEQCLNLLEWLVMKLHENREEKLKPGDIILSGAISKAYPLAKGDNVEVAFTNLGTLSLQIA